MLPGGESALPRGLVSRGRRDRTLGEERADGGLGPGPGRGADRIERDARGSDDLAGPRVGKANVEPLGLRRAWVPEDEVDQGGGRPTATADPAPHPKPVLPHDAGQRDTLRIPPLDEELVAPQSDRDA